MSKCLHCLLCFCLLFLIIFPLSCLGYVTVTPELACPGDSVTVDCMLSVLNPGDLFVSIETRFFVGSSNASLSESNINSGTGDPLIRLTAVADLSSSNNTFLVGSLTLSSFSSSDNGLRLGCEGRYVPSGGGATQDLTQIDVLKATKPVTLAESNTKVTIQIMRNLTIFAEVDLPLQSIERPDTLTHRFYLRNDTQTEISPPTANPNVTFSTLFTCDSYFNISVTAENCAGGSVNVSSKNFILQEVRKDTGYFKDPSDKFLIEWDYNLDFDDDRFEQDYLPKDYFNFSVANIYTGEVFNVPNFTLNLPQGFVFRIPASIDVTTKQYELRIEFIDPCFNITIPLNIERDIGNTVLIILIIIAVLLLVLLAIIITITISFVIIHFKRKRDSEK